MRILVAGGAGFLGSFLCDELIEMQHEVICVDNFFTGRKKNIEHLWSHPNFNFIEHDISQMFSLDVDGIINFACPASPKHYQKDPVYTFETNILGTMNLLRLAKEKKVRYLQASTSEVYGDPEISPQHESYWGNVNSMGIRSCYDEGKRAAETITHDYARQYSVDVGILRIFNTYGPRMSIDDGRVVSNFIVQALQGAPVTIYGDGRQTRSFCYVKDLIDGVVKMFFKRNLIGPINLGRPETLSINELSDLILKLTESKSLVIKEPLPNDDPRSRVPDIKRARDELNWEPATPLVNGLTRTIEYFKLTLQATEQERQKSKRGHLGK